MRSDVPKYTLLLLWVALLLAGCSDHGSTDVGNRDADSDGLDAATERQPVDEGLDGVADFVESDVVHLESNLGEGCAGQSDCKPGSPDCLLNTPSGKNGICSRECMPDDPKTDLINEDDCPHGFSCAQFVYSDVTYNYCLQPCIPSFDANPCMESSKTTCHPLSTRFSVADGTFCYYPACTDDKDCPVYSATTCSIDSQCTQLGATAFCDSEENKCALPGNCTQGGLCGPHGHGAANAKVGDPCVSDLECPSNGSCLTETNSGGVTLYRNGYCIVSYCSFAAALNAFACPNGSTCHNLFYGGLCHKICSLEEASSCRDEPGLEAGDYDCHAWDNLYLDENKPVTEAPVCVSTRVWSCGSLGSDLDCSILGMPEGNPTAMRCRDPLTGATLNATDPDGVCLDDTVGGPFPQAPMDGGGLDATSDVGPSDAGVDLGG